MKLPVAYRYLSLAAAGWQLRDVQLYVKTAKHLIHLLCFPSLPSSQAWWRFRSLKVLVLSVGPQ